MTTMGWVGLLFLVGKYRRWEKQQRYRIVDVMGYMTVTSDAILGYQSAILGY